MEQTAAAGLGAEAGCRRPRAAAAAVQRRRAAASMTATTAHWLRLLHLINVTEAAHKLREAGPVTGVVVPAASHECVKDRRTEFGLGQPVPFLQHSDDILIFEPEERLLPKAEDLPHAYSKHPDITGGCEAAEVDGLGGHPFDG